MKTPLGFWSTDFGPAIHHAARTYGGHMHGHSLCGAAQHNQNQIRRRTIHVENLGVNLDNTLQGNQLNYQGRNPTKAARHSKVFWQITSEI